MKVHIITIVLNGMPFISWQYPIFRRLRADWRWWVVDGAAMPGGCTRWCARLKPQISEDTTGHCLFYNELFDKRITRLIEPSWPGKAAMFNAALAQIDCTLAPGEMYLLWQIDSDEIWTHEQLGSASGWLAGRGDCNCAWFRCRYFVGPDIVITSRDGFGNNVSYEWKRLWKVTRGARFVTHEPPRLAHFLERPIPREQTEEAGLVFDHFAYATEAQMQFKQHYYGSEANPNGKFYHGCVHQWRRLQTNTEWPVKELKEYFPWVGNGVTADRVAMPRLVC